MGLTGTWMHDQRHNYYPEFRRQSRYQNQSRVLRNELPTITTLEEEERPTYFQRLSKETCLLGLSPLHRLHLLYGFNVLTDSVFDVMYLLP